MAFRLLNRSIVIAGENYNPTLLHPTLLKAQNIIPTIWELAEQPVITPLVTLIKYDNGIVFLNEPKKFQITDNEPLKNPDSSNIPIFARKYVQIIQKLSPPDYIGVGLNFSGFVDITDASSWLTSKFIKPGSWNSGKPKLEATSLRFSYSYPNFTLNLSFDPGEILEGDTGSQYAGILIYANYHYPVKQNQDSEISLKAVKSAITRFSNRYDGFMNLMIEFFDLE